MSKLSDGYAKLKADVIILEDALKKAKASVADEIEKCNRYRKQIRDLELKERDLIKLQSEFKTLEQSNHINQKQIADLKKERLNIVENQKKLISDCND